MLKIKLSPRGKKHQITYRIVVAEDRSKLNGKVIDDLGFYTPQTKTFEIDKKKMAQWQKNGAHLTIGVDKLLNPKKHPNKKKSKKVKEGTVAPEKKEVVNKQDIQTPTEEKQEQIPQNDNKEENKTEETKEENKETEVKEEK